MKKISCSTTDRCDYAGRYGLLDIGAISDQGDEHDYRRQGTKLSYNANSVFSDNGSRLLLMPVDLLAFGHCQNALGSPGMHAFVAGIIFRRRKGADVKTTYCRLNQPHNLLRLARFDKRFKLFDYAASASLSDFGDAEGGLFTSVQLLHHRTQVVSNRAPIVGN